MGKALTADILRELVDYNPETGEFTRRIASRNSPAGKVINSRRKDGYCRATIMGKKYLVHRLVWLYEFGRWPTNFIDHIDMDPSNNRLANLRECTHSENMQNRKHDSGHGYSKYLGVSYRPDRGVWVASMIVNGKIHRVGRFKTEEEAFSAYLEAKAKIHEFQPVFNDLEARRKA